MLNWRLPVAAFAFYVAMSGAALSAQEPGQNTQTVAIRAQRLIDGTSDKNVVNKQERSTTATMMGRDYAANIALRTSAGFRAALDEADAQLKDNPMDADAEGVRALVYANGVDFLAMSGRDTRPAKLAALALARKVAPTNPWTRAAFGLIHMFDDTDAATAELGACIRESPGFLECYNLLGDLLRKSKQYTAADDVYLKGLSRWPTDGELLVSYALSLQQQGYATKGIEILNRLVSEQPTFPRGHWHLAVMMYEAGGDRALIRAEAERALSLDPLIWHGRTFIDFLDGTSPAPF